MKKVKEYSLCILGSVIVAAGVYFFKYPNNFSIGGVSGIAVILSNYFHFSSVGSIITVINLFLLIIGFFMLGIKSSAKTIVGTAVFSGATILFENLIPLSHPITDEPLLELFFAVLLPAVGSAIIFNVGGTTGGTDIVAMILKKYTTVNIGTSLLISDVGITLCSFLFGVKTGLYSILGLILKSAVIDIVIENINLCKWFSITVDNPDGISDFINNKLKRSCSIIESKGAYSHNKKYIITAVVKRHQAARLQQFLKAEYPSAFIIIANSSEIIGKGFRDY